MRKKKRVIIYLVLLLLLLVWTVYNYKNNQDFFNASLVNIITIGLAIFVSYFLSQKNNNVRKQKDIILDLLLKLQNQVE